MNTMPMPVCMARVMPAVLLLAACTPAASDAASTPAATVAGTNAVSMQAPSAAPLPTARTESTLATSIDSRVAEPTGASISGGIRDGNRPPPALRVCATPIDGGTATCIDTVDGARDYRIEVAPGRYYLLGWVQTGTLTLIAHASQIRCIRAPCPPDQLIQVTVAAGQQLDGIDLNGAYVDIPAGWPKQAD